LSSVDNFIWRLHFSLRDTQMKDSEVSTNLKKSFPRERPAFVIEKTSRIIKRQCESRTGCANPSENGVRKILLSLPRVKWLERPDVII